MKAPRQFGVITFYGDVQRNNYVDSHLSTIPIKKRYDEPCFYNSNHK